MGNKVSAVIPVYNAEAYLTECLNSVLAQSLKEIEVICIDDGSTDGSAAILKSFQECDPQIRIIRQENAGLSAARNTGIRNATGEFIGFVDSDDIIDKDFFLRLYEAAEDACADIAAGGIVKFGAQQKEETLVAYKKKRQAGGLNSKFDLCHVPWHNYTCNKIYRREMLLEEKLFFREGRYFEDMWWTPETLYAAATVVAVPGIRYYYRQTPTSICHTMEGNRKKKKDYQEAVAFLADFIHRHAIMPTSEFDKMTRCCILGIPVLKTVENAKLKKIYFLGIKILEFKYKLDTWHVLRS